MATDYSFFEDTLCERRTYRFQGEQAAYHFGRLRACSVADELEVRGEIAGEAADFTVVGTHLMNPGNPIGIAAINERLNITLPQEVDDFYRRWDGGFLLFREMYPLLSVQEMIDVTLEYRASAERRYPSLPYSLIRFCNLGNADYLALYSDDRRPWQIIFKSMEYPDEDYYLNWSEHPGAVLDPTFRCWLNRMVETDGWPLGGKWIYPDDAPPPGLRVR